MKKSIKSGILSVFLCQFALSVATASELAESFGKMPLVKDVSISPDGQTMAGIFNISGKQVVMTTLFGQHDTTPLVSLKSSSDRIESVDWVSNKRLLIRASRPEYLAGQVFRVHSMYAVDLDGSKLLEIRNQANIKRGSDNTTLKYQSMTLLNDLAEDDEHVLLRGYDERDNGYAVYKVNINTNKFTKIESAAGNRAGFVSDRQGNIVFSTVVDKHMLSIELKKSPDQPWTRLKTIDLTGDMDFTALELSQDGKSVLINTDHQSDFNYLANFDLTTGAISAPIYQVEGHDIEHTYHKAGKMIGYSFTKDFPEQIFIDQKQQSYNAQIKALLPDRHSYITSYSDDGQRVVIYSVKDNQPGRYLTLDFNTKKAAIWFSQYPHLEQKSLPTVQNIEFTSRDGLKIHGYLTLPLATEKAAPVILFPHGGPIARDSKTFDPFVQFFTAMGYAVLQVNYRGSAGYGNQFEMAGYQQWGKKMQDDLMDALAAIDGNTKVDTKRSCMVGASYGGYSAMVASFRDSAQFQCFVSISGISDLTAMLKLDGAYNETMRALQKTTIGDYQANPQALDAVSAIHHVNKINKPMLLIHGIKDTQVSYKQSVALYDALKKLGRDVTYLEQPDGTHYFDTEQERVEAFAAMETFLKKHLPL